MNKEKTIKDEMMASKCGWTPYDNFTVKGFPVTTIVNGKIVMADGKVEIEGTGQPLDF
jgi:dihydroorotase